MNMQPRQWFPLLTAVFFVLSANPVSAQKKPAPAAPIGMPQDWSHRHVVYPNPDTPQEAAKKGQTAKWRKNYRDPRFVLALSRKLDKQEAAKYARNAKKVPPRGTIPLKPRELISANTGLNFRPKPVRPGLKSGIHRDWSHVLGGGIDGLGGVGTPGVYPAKYSFDIYADPDCANDFVVYSTGTAGSTASANGAETWSTQFTGGTVDSTGTVVINRTGTVRDLTLTASATPGTNPLLFQQAGTQAQRAASLAAAVNRWSHQTGIIATISGAGSDAVTFSNNTPGNVSDNATVVENLSNSGPLALANGSNTAGQPTIVAFNQLYATCNNDNPKQPRVFWSYNTGNGAIVRTSPVISYYDGGKQVAFIQSSGGVASLVLLKWSSTAPGTAGAPTTPTSQTPANYRSCTAPCMTVMPLNGNPDNLVSSPYIDYSGDVAWVGAANGTLHKFTGVFAGTPAEVTTGGFPANVSTGNALSSPVVDFGSGQIFIGSASNGGASGGMLHRVNSSTGAVTNSAKLTANISLGILASPIVDAGAARAYVFVYNDGSTNCNSRACRAVVQFNTAFAANNAGTKVTVGRGEDPVGEQYIGTFDDAYYSSPTPDGALYVAGGSPTQQWVTVLWKIPIVGNVMGTPIRGATISGNDLTAGSYTSPISEIKNGVNDYLYVGVHDYATDGAANVCGTGAVGSACLYMFNLSDLNGSAANSNETWTDTSFTGTPGNGQTIQVDGITLTASNTLNTGAFFQVAGAAGNTADQRAANLRNAVNRQPGLGPLGTITASGTDDDVILTYNTAGDVADNLVLEGLTGLGLTNVDGAGGTAWATTNVPSAGLSVSNGTGGIILDNISADPDASQIYFSNLSTPGNAYQVSQDTLE